MAESFADDLERDAVLDEQAGMGVSEVVEPGRRQTRSTNDPVERLREGVRVRCAAVLGREQPLGDCVSKPDS